MAYFAKLDKNNLVLEVHAINNSVLDPNNEEVSGVAFLTEWSGGYSNWKRTSYNGNYRKNYAGIGYTFDSVRDAFIPPKPYPSWILNEDTCLWDSPVPRPEGEGLWDWDENSLSWVEVTF